MYLEHQKHKEPSHGKIPVKKLVGQGEGAKSIEVTDSNIKSFERVARKYNARLWRQGQKETVMIYHIINKGAGNGSGEDWKIYGCWLFYYCC